MRAWLTVLVCLFALPGIAAGDEKPPTVDGAVEAILKAVHDGDQQALDQWAAMSRPDPWLVADALIDRAEGEVALLFAHKRSTGAEDGLLDYVRLRRDERDASVRTTYRAVQDARSRRDWAGTVAAAQALPDPPITVPGIRAWYTRGYAHARLGQHVEAAAAMRRAGEAAAGLGWPNRAFWALRMAGGYFSTTRDYAQAVAAYSKAIQIVESLGEDSLAAAVRVDRGAAHYNGGDLVQAERDYTHALEALARSGDTQGEVRVLGRLGDVYQQRKDYRGVQRTFERLLGMKGSPFADAEIPRCLNRLAQAYKQLADYDMALDTFRRAAAIHEASGDVPETATAYVGLGSTLRNLGAYAEALAAYRTSHALLSRFEDPRGRISALVGIANAHEGMGSYAAALDVYGRALAQARSAKYVEVLDVILLNIGLLRMRLQDHEAARAAFDQVLASARASGDRRMVASTLGHLGRLFSDMGDLERAQATMQDALALARELGDERNAASLHLELGHVRLARDDPEGALAAYREGLEAMRHMGAQPGVAAALLSMGRLHLHLSDPTQAKATLAAALLATEDAPGSARRARAYEGLAEVCYGRKEWSECVAHARTGVELVARLSSGLGDEQGARAKDGWARLFRYGAAAAARARRPEDFAYFLESARAAGLREALQLSTKLQDALVPAELAQKDRQAQADIQRAASALRAARGRESLRFVRARKADLLAAQRARSEVIAEIQRAAKAGASLVYPQSDDLATIQSHLREGEALVLYGVPGFTSVALVIEQSGGAHLRVLAPTSEIDEAVAALALQNPKIDAKQAADRLRALLVVPLQLPESTRRVLVSPAGRLAYVPFALLLPSREIAYVPSGTTLGAMRAQPATNGAQVLAIGDPNYARGGTRPRAGAQRSGWTLTPLPATREEVQRVGDTVLVGDRATKLGVWDALRMQAGWRAVHFACHGLVDPALPMLSSLALTPDDEDDGYLTCMDVYRARIPADAVVLSACETGRGRIYQTEGIVGLTRAFMFAGAPRVICSLWKVDDEATQALMIRFYELWNPKDGKKGLGAAAALEKAQEYVRDLKDHRGEQKWKHPYYWAAWVLWGLPG